MVDTDLQPVLGGELPQGGLSEDKRLEDEISNLRLQFPNKEFRIVGNEGKKRIEVVLDW